jgi:hypothetical protein
MLNNYKLALKNAPLFCLLSDCPSVFRFVGSRMRSPGNLQPELSPQLRPLSSIQHRRFNSAHDGLKVCLMSNQHRLYKCTLIFSWTLTQIYNKTCVILSFSVQRVVSHKPATNYRHSRVQTVGHKPRKQVKHQKVLH